jgi:hypothetical protein
MSDRDQDDREDPSDDTLDAPSSPAEAFLWRHLAAALERRGHDEAALQLRHQLKAVDEGEGPEGEGHEGGFKRVRLGLFARVSEMPVTYDASTAERRSWVLTALEAGRGAALSRADALELATRAAMPPAGAVLVSAEYEEQGGAPVFVARWAHREDGIPLERDFIQVLVNGATGQVFAVHRQWHAPRLRSR